jgi:hypothetical protein
VDPAQLHLTGEELAETVARTKPRIALGAGGQGMGGLGRSRDAAAPGAGERTSITVTAWTMQPGDDRVVADLVCMRCSSRSGARRGGGRAGGAVDRAGGT